MSLTPAATTAHLATVPERSPRCEELISRIAGEIDPHTDEIGTRLVERIAAEMDLIRDDEDIREDLLTVARACAALLTEMTRAWTDPRVVPPPRDALVWARSLVARDLPIDVLLRVYRIGQAGYRDIWHRELAASGADPDLILEALRATSAFTFIWVDAILAVLIAAYEEERERSGRDAHAVRLETVEAILAGEPLDMRAASARLGYDLHRSHLGCVAWVEPGAGEAARDEIDRLVAELFVVLGGPSDSRPLLLRAAPRVVFAWLPRARPGTEERQAARELLRGTQVHIAVGTLRSGVEGFRDSHDEARRARRVARLLQRSSPVTAYPDVAVVDLLTRDPEAARAVARSTLGGLARDDDGSRRLLATLRVFFQEGQSFARTARRLGVHENTVSYRVHRAAELAGHADPGSFVLRAAVELAPLLDGEDVDLDRD